MKKFKKIVAVATATVLALTPMTAFAQTSTGDGGVENDNSTAPSYNSVVLPVFGSNAFDFTLDPDGLLHEYDPATYETTDTLLFNSVKNVATLTITSGDTKLYKVKYDEVEASALETTLKADLDIDADSGQITLKASPTNTYYVWTPKADTGDVKGLGEYTKITDSNLHTYFGFSYGGSQGSYTIGSISQANGKLEASATNGKLYTLGYEVVTAEDAAEYVTANTGETIDAMNAGLYGYDGSSIYTAVTKDTAELVYTPATTSYKGASDSIKIVNKSTKDMDVTVSLTVTNATGLTFTGDKNFQDAEGEADPDSLVYLAITDGSNAYSPVTVSEDGKATITGTYTLDKATNNVLKYMTTATDPLTGGHVYKQYENNDTSYDSMTLKVEGAANANATAGAWDAYAEALRAYEVPELGTPANIRPGLEVVYTIAEHEDREVVNSAYTNWAASTLWLAASASEGFDGTVESVTVTPDGGREVALTSVTSDVNWVSTTWDNLVAGGVTVGNTYVIKVTTSTKIYVINMSA